MLLLFLLEGISMHAQWGPEPILASPLPFAVGTPREIFTGDLNGDGIDDAVVLDFFGVYHPAIEVLLGSRNQLLPRGPTVPGMVLAVDGELADINRDGKLDLVVCSRDSLDFRVYLGKGDGSFNEPAIYPTGGTQNRELAVADFDRNGVPDVAVAQESGVRISYFNGERVVQSTRDLTGFGTTLHVVAADFDQDGDPDLAVVGNTHRTTDRLRDFLAEQLRVALAHAMNRCGHGADAQANPFTEFLVGDVAAHSRQVRLHRDEHRVFHGTLIFPAQHFNRLGEQRMGPASIVELFRREGMDQVELEPLLVVVAVQRHEHHRPAPFQSRGLASFVTEEVLEDSKQEGSEPSLLRGGGFKRMSLQNVLEEALSQILRVRGFVSVPPDERVDRVPIGPAKLLERLRTLLLIVMLNVQDNAPVRGAELRCIRRRLLRFITRAGHTPR